MSLERFFYAVDVSAADIKEKETNICSSLALSDSNRIQTYNLLIRSQMLYSVELWSRCFSQLRCKGIAFFDTAKCSKLFFIKNAIFLVLSLEFCSKHRLLLHETAVLHVPTKGNTCVDIFRCGTVVIDVGTHYKGREAAYQ